MRLDRVSNGFIFIHSFIHFFEHFSLMTKKKKHTSLLFFALFFHIYFVSFEILISGTNMRSGNFAHLILLINLDEKR